MYKIATHLSVLFFIAILLCSVDVQAKLLIITPAEFKDSLLPLMAHKNKTGMPTQMLTLESIDQDYTGSDMPEKIKRAIAAYNKDYKIVYVLLAGDTDKFPIRYIKGINTEWGTRYYPSDLYYADLYDDAWDFDDWDYDNDGFYGETDFLGGPNTVNLDRINLNPDVAVGRIPASTVAEISAYVSKIIKYEFNTWRSSWTDKAMIISDHDTSGAFSDLVHAESTANSLTNFTISKFYQKNWPYSIWSPAERALNITTQINDGRHVILHMGHGNTNSWSGFYGTADMSGLTNSDRFPIIFTIACLTATFHYGPEIWQQDRYRTVTGTEWNGAGFTKTVRPMPADLQPGQYDVESMAEEFLTKRDTGAIAYIGTAAKAEHGVKALQRYFAEEINNYNAYSWIRTLGEVWRYAMVRFVANDAQPGMGYYYAYIHQHKTMLFGDPSLRVGGVPSILKSDFLGEWVMTYNGQHGILALEAVPDNPIEYSHNIKGTYTDSEGNVYRAQASVLTPNYYRGDSWVDNKMELTIDFNNDYYFGNDQVFTLYLSGSKTKMNGTVDLNGKLCAVSLVRKPFPWALFLPAILSSTLPEK